MPSTTEKFYDLGRLLHARLNTFQLKKIKKYGEILENIIIGKQQILIM